MTDFLLELLSEEIPARMQARARDDLQRLFAAELAAAGLAASAVETYSTPRRLALIARGLPDETAPVREERRGPRADAPDQAIQGFLGSTGLERGQLETRDDKKGAFLYAIVETPGRPTREILSEAIPRIVRDFPWLKSMRWGADSSEAGSLRWVRPLHNILAIFGQDEVPVAIPGVPTGATTVGHRFRHPGPITIGGADDYSEKLRACHVILDQEERAAIIRDGALALAAEAGLELIEDEGLVTENAALTEWPVSLLGSFDEAFLAVPPEVITLTMRTNQKYFALRRADGALSPNFICTANIDAADGGAAIVAGNRKVLAARLADARYFWEQDLKTPLEEHAKKLDQIVFHEKLGTVADKVERVAKLARWLVEEEIVGAPPPQSATPRHSRESGNPAFPVSSGQNEEESWTPAFAGVTKDELAQLALDAARLCKADLVTQMVGEFPELQGAIGGYYAAAQGLDPRIAAAIRDHYKPVGQGDEVPTEPVTVAVSLADKLDTIARFFAIDETPTGSKDPFALRRAILGVLSLCQRNSLRLPFDIALAQAMGGTAVFHYNLRDNLNQEVGFEPTLTVENISLRALLEKALNGSLGGPIGGAWRSLIDQIVEKINSTTAFIADRLKVQQREAGVRHDLIDAVFALGGEDDLVRLLARVKALQAFVETDEGANLLAGYKRAANILKKENWSSEQGANKTLSYIPEKEETALIVALDSAETAAATAIEAEDFEVAMAALASLRAPVDVFFDEVTVNDADPVKRAARLALLARVRDAVHRVADFSKIEG